MDDEGNAVLSDVGWNLFLDHSDAAGAAVYGSRRDVRRLAPEFLETGEYTIQTDIYSYACLGLGG